MKESDIALITIVHDPTGLLVEPLKKVIAVITNYFNYKYVAVSEFTAKELVELLTLHHFKVFTVEKRGAAEARRGIINLVGPFSHGYYHYCDLDRLVTWMLMYPDELEMVHGEAINHDYLILGRTKKAFISHPVAWQETELISNKIFSVNFGQEVDICAGSCIMSRKALMQIAEKSKSRITDAEWPLIVGNMSTKQEIGFIETDGLMYLDFNKSKASSELEEWHARVKLLFYISESIQEVQKARE
ncbi:hypothetical protein [Paenibacillus sp. FSL R10-2734]|uniref:hypothetical protein n=1 Tax=Paenibacillus sp. FSL R10-2734 TaxID=2954691 RepID=UPI0030D93B43